MILLSLLQQMETDEIGTINTDLFYEEAPLNNNGNPKEGAWIVSRGAPVTRHNTGIQSFDIYSRRTNKLQSAQKLQEILEYLQDSFSDVCELPAVSGYTTQAYTNVTIEPTSGVESVGADEQDRQVFVISGVIRYAKKL